MILKRAGLPDLRREKIRGWRIVLCEPEIIKQGYMEDVKMEFQYVPKGVCSQMIAFEIDNGLIHNVRFTGGCNGNGQGVAALAENMKAEEFIKRCKEIKCGVKNTSCPAQLAMGVEQALEKMDKIGVQQDG